MIFQYAKINILRFVRDRPKLYYHYLIKRKVIKHPTAKLTTGTTSTSTIKRSVKRSFSGL